MLSNLSRERVLISMEYGWSFEEDYCFDEDIPKKSLGCVLGEDIRKLFYVRGKKDREDE